ncbi:MAG TPA: hypothetical protein PKX05_00605, partial [bacterium]|nr:hypothetical protein [bacterium]
KEMLGVYRTGHPLENCRETLSHFVDAWSSQIQQLSEGKEYWFGGLIQHLKIMTSRKGEKMAVGELEDLYGRMEVVFYPQVYENISSILKTSNIVFIKGRIEHRSEKGKIIAKELATLNTISEKQVKNLNITINIKTSKELLGRIKNILSSHRGNSPIMMIIKDENNTFVKVRLTKFQVAIVPELLEGLKDILSQENISLN